MYKNRMYETIFLREYGHLFEDNKIMPYIEVIFYKIGRTNSSIEELVEYYDKIINSKYFIDLFTFSEAEYSQPNLAQLTKSLQIRSHNEKEYFSLLLKTINSSKSIPVVSIKKARDNLKTPSQLSYLLKELKKHKEQIAVRIEGRLYNKYKDVLSEELRENDYLFYDIKENNTDPFTLDFSDLENMQGFIKILANSPRKRSLNNGSYICNNYTDLIDNSVRDEYLEYNFQGYSDYSGLKDDLPRSGGGGFGAALAMLYDYTKNKYYTITNPDTKKGNAGYETVIEEIKKEELKSLLRLNDCLSYEYIQKSLIDRDKNGTYAVWNLITMIRVLSEMKKFRQ